MHLPKHTRLFEPNYKKLPNNSETFEKLNLIRVSTKNTKLVPQMSGHGNPSNSYAFNQEPPKP
jgi:hypothetical protein